MQNERPSDINEWIFGGLMAMQLLVIFTLPALHANAAIWLPMLVLMAWLSIVQWGLIHEAIHKLLFASPRANEIGGRVLSIMMGTSFQVLRFGHLMHHKLNRQFHSEVVDRITPRAKVGYYAHLLFGTYATEVIAGILMTLLPRQQLMHVMRHWLLKSDPDVASAGERFFYERGNIHALRVDVIISVALYTTVFALASSQWIWVAAFLILRAMVISFMDNIYHYDTAMDKAGKELWLPPALSAMLLHGNYHETHHTSPGTPWHQLPALHDAQNRAFDGDFVAHGIMQFDGPPLRTA